MPENPPQELLRLVPMDAQVIIPTLKRACIQAGNDASPLLSSSSTSSSSSSSSFEMFLSCCSSLCGAALPISLLSPSDLKEEYCASCRMIQKEETEMDQILIKNGFQLIPLQILDPLNKQLQATTLIQSKTNTGFVDVILIKMIELTGDDRLPAGNLGGEWKACQQNADQEGVPVNREDDQGGENGGLQGGAGGGAGGGGTGGNGGEDPNVVLDKALCFICQENPFEFRTYCGHAFRVCDRCIGCHRGCPRCRQPLARRVRFNLHPRRQEANHTPLIPAPQIPLPRLEPPAPLYPPPLLVPEHHHPPNVGGLKIHSNKYLIFYDYVLPNGEVLRYPYLL